MWLECASIISIVAREDILLPCTQLVVHLSNVIKVVTPANFLGQGDVTPPSAPSGIDILVLMLTSKSQSIKIDVSLPKARTGTNRRSQMYYLNSRHSQKLGMMPSYLGAALDIS